MFRNVSINVNKESIRKIGNYLSEAIRKQYEIFIYTDLDLICILMDKQILEVQYFSHQSAFSKILLSAQKLLKMHIQHLAHTTTKAFFSICVHL